jgi:peroxiredoxin
MPMVKTERALLAAIGLLMAAMVFLIADTLRERVVVVGDTAPDFSIKTDNGLTISPGNFGGKLMVLNFWATWCPPCVEELPSLNQFQRNLRDSGVVVLGISVDKNEQTYKNFLRRHQVSFLTARDPEAGISGEYGTFRYPETYVINAQGKVVQKIIGPAQWTEEKMVRYIQSLL